MNIRKFSRIKGFLLVLALLIIGLQIQGDDKELFMGGNLDANRIKANVVILMDSSGSMNTIIFYPKDGLDRISGTSDDGFDSTIAYSGTPKVYEIVDGNSVNIFNTTSYMYRDTTQWYGVWTGKTSNTAEELNNSVFVNSSGKKFYTVVSTASTDGINFKVDGNSVNLRDNDVMLFKDSSAPNTQAVVRLVRKYKVGSAFWIEVEIIYGDPISGTLGSFQQSPIQDRWTPAVVKLYGTTDNGFDVRYPRNYLNWVFLHATDAMRKSISYFSTYGTFVDTGTPPGNISSSCSTPAHARTKQTFTRIQVAREVICNVATTSVDLVKLGLFKFGAGDEGGELKESLGDMSTNSTAIDLPTQTAYNKLLSYKDKVWSVYGGSNTPLAEALADIWHYYKPDANPKSYWPVDYEINTKHLSPDKTEPDSPIKYWCQNNYVVIMTDGESTMDRFTGPTNKFDGSIFLSSISPVKRQTPWTSWSNGWGDSDSNDIKNSGYIPASYNPAGTYCPNYTCWATASGSDLLDDVAYFMRHQDMFPDDYFVDIAGKKTWPGDQNIYTYAIGFTANNDMLLQTAVNGDGAYYTANNYDELVNAFQLVLTSINLRNFAFSAITAPKKTATATNADQTVSYVGYLVPSNAGSIWEGHLLSYQLIDKWGYDIDGDGTISPEEYLDKYKTQEDCLKDSGGATCFRSVKLNIGHDWDAADKMPTDRKLFSNTTTTDANGVISLDRMDFNLANKDNLKPLLGTLLSDEDITKIINKITTPWFADVFHADVGFVGAPPFGKKFVNNINPPPGEGVELYETFWEAQKERTKVIYTGTNDGVMHMIMAEGIDAGKEQWGYLPDAIMPSLKNIVIDNKHTYTVDGRFTAQDVFFKKDATAANTWSTLLTFGLRAGGKSFYTLDITNVGASPTLLWKFEDPEYSGESWSKPVYGRVKFQEGNTIEDKWVVFFTGGFAFNSENPADKAGKAIFMADAVNGKLLWMIGYDATQGAAQGAPSANEQTKIAVSAISSTSVRYLTKSPLFNFPIPAAITTVDKDNDGYIDTLYFGNVGGHLFKTVFTDLDRSNWNTYVVYERKWITDRVSSPITAIGLPDADNKRVITVNSVANFRVGYGVMGKLSYANGNITAVDTENNKLTVKMVAGTFQVDEQLANRTYDSIYLSPAVFFDRCYQLWIVFGTGDRDRPLTNVINGRFIGIRDNGTTNSIEDASGSTSSATLQYIPFGTGADANKMEETALITNANGWYFNFSAGDLANDLLYGEKLFDPEPVVLPDNKLVPHVYFNTYQPPATAGSTSINCDTPQEGTMSIYDLSIVNCGNLQTISGERATGRIAGGGIYEGKEYVIYKSTSGQVADVPGGEGGEFLSDVKRLPYSGGIVFWKEKKR